MPLRFFFILFLFSLQFICNLKSEEYSGEFFSVVPGKNGVINYGPCFLTDSVQINFLAHNKGEKPLLVDKIYPTFVLALSPNDITMNQFRRFSRVTDLPKTFQPGQTDTIKLKFVGGDKPGDTLDSPTGWHEALLGLAFFPGDVANPVKEISKIDTFLLRVKKTPYFVSGYEDNIYFDSVYIFPNNIPTEMWRVKNVWTTNQPLTGFEKKLITQPFSETEIIVNELPVNNLIIYPDSIIYLPVNYYPRNQGRDSMYLKLLYKPLPDVFPDSVDFAWTRISGIGVEQKLTLISSDINWNQDTINIGEINLKNKLEINLTVKNKGNLPFGFRSQDIVQSDNDQLHKDFKFVKEFSNNGNHLPINAVISATIEFSPTEVGYFSARIRIGSDILERQIRGVQPSQRYQYIYIKGNIISPKISASVKDIDLGNVVLSNAECPSERDTIITVFNSGNAELVINRINFVPGYPVGKFYSSVSQLKIQPNKSEDIKISFKVTGGDYNFYESQMQLITNQPAPNDTFRINLKAQSVPPITATLSIPVDLKSKPGTIIEVPLTLISQNIKPAAFAKTFTTSLFYNRTMLEYTGTRTIGTATEGALNHGDPFENPDSEELRLEINTPSSTFFFARDTVIFLRFKTFLGTAAATEISLIEPKFGDGNCENIFSVINSNGVYNTDSVCGLEYKVLPSVSGSFSLNIPSPNLSGNNEIEFELPYSTLTAIKIFDVYGNEVITLLNQSMPSGKYSVNGNTGALNSGMYFAELTTPAIRIIKPMVILK